MYYPANNLCRKMNRVCSAVLIADLSLGSTYLQYFLSRLRTTGPRNTHLKIKRFYALALLVSIRSRYCDHMLEPIFRFIRK